MPLLKLRNHIPIAGPARREPTDGSETDMRVSFGFEPAWFHRRCGIDFSERWHNDPYYRFKSLEIVKSELVKTFPSATHWDLSRFDDLATISGVYGIYPVLRLFGIPLRFTADRWPTIPHDFRLSLEDLEQCDADALLQSPAVEELLEQMDTIRAEWGKIHGYLNWQGVLNNAFHLRGQDLFLDFYARPVFVHQLLSTICNVMIRFARMVQEKQRDSGFYINQLSVSNCVMNMISPEMYREVVFPYDKKIALHFERFGVHTCNWDITPYIDVLGELPGMGYLDMGMDSNLARVKEHFPETRRAVLYSPIALHDNQQDVIERDMRRIYEELSPCDVVVADIQYSTPDGRVNALIDVCRGLENSIFSLAR